jgi:hypothetical protein
MTCPGSLTIPPRVCDLTRERCASQSTSLRSKGNRVLFAGSKFGAHTLKPSLKYTLKTTLEQPERLTGRIPQPAYTDGSYKGHDYTGECQVHVDQKRRGTTSKSTWKWLKRRAAIEPTTGHLEDNKRLDKNRLKGSRGNTLNVLFSAAALNFAKPFKATAALPSSLHSFIAKLWVAFCYFVTPNFSFSVISSLVRLNLFIIFHSHVMVALEGVFSSARFKVSAELGVVFLKHLLDSQ